MTTETMTDKPAPVEVTPSAWLYERKPEAWPAAPSVIVETQARWAEDDTARPFWTETPLYTAEALTAWNARTVQAGLVEELRKSVGIMEAALQQIAGSHWERFGVDQTDIEELPDLSADEAMNLARRALMDSAAITRATGAAVIAAAMAADKAEIARLKADVARLSNVRAIAFDKMQILENALKDIASRAYAGLARAAPASETPHAG